MSLIRAVGGFTSRFAREERGMIAVVFALSLLPLAMFAGGAIDLTRMYGHRDKLQTIADLAMESALQGDRATPVETRIAAARRTVTNLSQDSNATKNIVPEIAIRHVDKVVQAKITLTSSFDLAFGKLFRIPTADIAATSARDKNFGVIDDRLMLCHIGRPEDIKRLNCGA